MDFVEALTALGVTGATNSISKRYECIMAIIGIIMVNLAIFKGGDRIDIRL